MAKRATTFQAPSKAVSPGVISTSRRIETGSWEGGHPAERPHPDRRIIKAPLSHTGNVGEMVAPNLFPVLEYPQNFYSAEARFQTESEIIAACGAPGPLPFLLRKSTVYTFELPTRNSVLAPALKMDRAPSQERFADWLAKPECAPWTIGLLDRILRYHAWKRGLRFDETHKLFYFTRSKPKTVWWEIGGRTIQQEVTAPRLIWTEIEPDVKAETQFGWTHQAVRAGFVQISDALFLRLEPTGFMTELDGKTPATTQSVGPVDSQFINEDSGPQALRLLQFWSAVLTKGHRELRIAPRNPIRVRLTPAVGSGDSSVQQDQMDSQALMNTRDDRRIPELLPLES